MKQNFYLFLFGLSLLSSSLCNAKIKVNPLLKCLGDEELRLHKAKSTGPAYFINQALVNELIGANNINLRPNYLNQICNSTAFSPSVTLLRLLILEGQKIFILSVGENEDPKQKSFEFSAITRLISNGPKLFFSFLAQLQANTDRPNCLRQQIPEIDYFLGRFKYLETELSSAKLLKEKIKIVKIFNALKDFDAIRRRCPPIKIKNVKRN
jgi:hypothetical protein